MLRSPISIYVNWSAYDELSDTVELTEELAMKQFDECVRLRKLGVRFDSYLMDAFWYDPSGGYRRWRRPHWPDGPGRWLEACRREGLKPGLWFSGNTLARLECAPEWEDSLDPRRHSMCMFHGGFMQDYLDVLRYWYGRGIRLFKFDFFNFSEAAPSCVKHELLPSEIRSMNIGALRAGLASLRRECPEIIIIGYNGFQEVKTLRKTDLPLYRSVDPQWLSVFDSLYSGDMRPADMPSVNFWRSNDIYCDHMVKVFERNGFPLAGIDNAGFYIGSTGCCYRRRKAAWKSMLVLSLARGGLVNTCFGNLDLLDDKDAVFFSRVQSLFFHMLKYGKTATFGGIPGKGEAYGYISEEPDGALLTAVNPSQLQKTVPLPVSGEARILFRDSGFMPGLDIGALTLGPEQMALLGTGTYNDKTHDLGTEHDIRIPGSVKPLDAVFENITEKELSVSVQVPEDGCIRILLEQKTRDGLCKRVECGPFAHRVSAADLLKLEIHQNGKPVQAELVHDRQIWSGISWASAEIPVQQLDPGAELKISFRSEEAQPVLLTGSILHALYNEGDEESP